MSIFDTSLNDTFAKILLTMYVNIIDTTNKTKEINIDTLIAVYTQKAKVANIFTIPIIPIIVPIFLLLPVKC